ncbi:MAG: hypothetical protein J5942_02945 [Prevotella sp.]|nr:hypothetical protein [Prevotella sp.]MBP3744919.1 hypothetical protein [Prevotella sp.]
MIFNKDRDVTALTRLLVVLGLFMLAAVGSNYYGDSSEYSSSQYESSESKGGFYDTFFGLFTDEEESSPSLSGGGGGAYFSSIFGDFEFIFRVKNYKALEDDNLDEMDHLVH